MVKPNSPKRQLSPNATAMNQRAPENQPSSNELDCPEERWRNVTDAEVNGLLAAVTSAHNPENVRTFLEYIYERNRAGERINERALVGYLTHVALRVVEVGEDLEVAFGIRAEKGKYDRPETFGRDMSVAAEVILRYRKLKSLSAAKEEAASALFPNDSEADRGRVIVDKAYKDHEELLNTLDDKFLDTIRIPK